MFPLDVRRQARLVAAQTPPGTGMQIAVAVLLAVFLLFPFAQQSASASATGEVVALRTATSKTLRNDDGTLTTRLYSSSIHYRAGREWREIDDELVSDSTPGYARTNRANRFHVRFKDALEDDYLRLDFADQRFTLSPAGALRASLRSAGKAASYDDAFEKVDLRYDVLPDGVKETLVLHAANAPAHYRFLLDGDVADVSDGGDGSWVVTGTARDVPAFTFAAPEVRDANGVVAVAAPGDKDAAVSLDVKRVGDRWAVDLGVSERWLHEEGRAFPVELDPTITIQPPVQNGSWDQSCLVTCGATGGTRLSIGSDATKSWRAGLLFDVGAVPIGANVTDAKLNVYFDGTCLGTCPSGGLRLDAHKLTSFWTTASKGQEATFDATALGAYTLPASAPAQWLSWPITATLERWRLQREPNFGVLLKSGTEGAGSGGVSVPSASYATPAQRPYLEVTYVDDGFELLAPDTLHASGADLRWTPFVDPGGAPFDRYEIHRSTDADFTPTEVTRLATLRDPSVTSFEDRTAAPGRTFTYKVVANGTATSTGRTVTLPADGRATKTLSLATAAGRGTYVVLQKNSTSCGNYGEFNQLRFGADATYVRRPLVKFDLRDIPAQSKITNATLSLFHSTAVPTTLTGTMSLHRVTSDWQEGTSGNGGCSGDGATWYDAYGGVAWSAPGADFAAANEATMTLPSGEAPKWHDFTLTSLVQSWVDAQQPNLGTLLKLDDETMTNGRWFQYVAEEYSVEPTLRPKLVVTYEDGSHAVAPTASVAAPGPGDLVRGSTVRVAAAVADDRRVDKVELLVDGVVTASDTAEPFEFTWNTTATTNATHKLAVRATDDAGNVSTPTDVDVTVDNSAAPATSVTSVTAAYAPEVAADVPAGQWRLGDSAGSTVAADASGNGAAGTVEGAAFGAAGAIAGDGDAAASFTPSGGSAAAVPSFAGGDAFAAASALAGRGGSVSGDSTNASKEAGEPAHAGNAGGHSLWWRWTAPASATVTIDTSGSAFDTLLAVYTGTAVNALTLRASNDDVSNKDRTSRVSFSAVANTTYQIAVDGYGGGMGAIELNWTQAGAPANDSFASAQSLAGGSGGTIGSNAGATKELNEPAHGGDGGGASVWFTWTAPASADVTVDTIGSQYDTTLGVYTGTTVGALTTIASDDDLGGNLTSAVTFAATSGTVYRIAVDGYVGQTGEFSLRWTQAFAPSISLGDRFDFPATSSFALEAWIKPTVVDATSRRIFSKESDDSYGHQGYSLAYSSSGLVFVRSRNGLADTVGYATPPAANAWTHVVAVYDGAASTMALYVNGAPVASTSAATKALSDNTSPLRIGRNSASGGDAVAGVIDEAAVYAGPLSAARAKSHYDAGVGSSTTVAHGTVTLAASASDDAGVDKVEFYVDEDRIATDTTAPFSAQWDTLAEAQPAYDGSHTITTKVYDAAGQMTTSSPLAIQVDNAGSSKYRATLATTAPPQAVTYDPASSVQDKVGMDVTVTNASGIAWSGSDVVLRYRWASPDPAPEYTTGSDIVVGDLAAGASRTVTVLVDPPVLAEGVSKAQYELRVDAYSKASAAWFASKGSKPLVNPVVVNKALVRGALGLESYYSYVEGDVGAGMKHLVNVANGNSILQWSPLTSPGRGLDTVFTLTYNALEKKCECPAGNNWSASLSGLVRLGNPIDIHPNKADEIGGNAKKYVEITDADGTTHRFNDTNNDGLFEPPAGVHLYVRAIAGGWAFTRPDRVTYEFDTSGYPTRVVDRNGNALTFTVSDVPPADDPGGPKRRVTAVTDAGGRTYALSFYTKADAKKSHIRGRIKRIANHGGHGVRFDYYEDGNLLRITEEGGTNADGSFLAPRTFVFTYTTSNGNSPAIADPAARVNPDPRTSNQSTRLYSVRDPRGNETRFSYLGSGNGEDRWKLASSTDRAGQVTTYAYDIVGRLTTVTKPLSRVWKYGYDVEGKVTSITNPLAQPASLAWSGDRMLTRVTETSGAMRQIAYNENGAVLSETDQTGAKTVYEYDNLPVDGGDVAARWVGGRTIPHLSQLVRRTAPAGVATASPADDHQWQYEYDAKGNPTKVIEPDSSVPVEQRPASTAIWNADGTIRSITNQNGRTTLYEYDTNGLQTKVTDVKGQVKTFAFDSDGRMLWLQDALHAQYTGGDPRTYRTYFAYDSFGRLGMTTQPKSTTFEPGRLVVESRSYDANDNVVGESNPYFSDGKPVVTTTTYDAMDRPTLERTPDTTGDPAGARTAYAYDAAGRLVSETSPNGVKTAAVAKDFTTEYGYDAVDRRLSETVYPVDGSAAGARVTRSCYDLAGDVRSVTSPLGAASFTGCPAAVTPYTPTTATHTTLYTYDAAHRQLTATDAAGRTRATSYDANGRAATYTDAAGKVTTDSYDERGNLVQVVAPYDATRTLTSRFEYDPAGNLEREITPRAWDASSDKSTFTDFVTTYQYDELDRRVRVDLPTKGQSTPAYVHSTYDAIGNVTSVSLPVAQRDQTLVGDRQKTAMAYFDTGWIRSSRTPDAQATTLYDYDADGQQLCRAEQRGGTDCAANLTNQMTWTYSPDGLVTASTDRGGQRSTFGYDADGNLTSGIAASGLTTSDQTAVETLVDYDGFGEQTKLRLRREPQLNGNYTVSRWVYDANGNAVQQSDDGAETPAGGTVSTGRQRDYAYDPSGLVTSEIDAGATSATGDDRRLATTYGAAGLASRVVLSRDSSAWQATRTTDFTYFDGGYLKTQKATNSAGNVVESHTLGYDDAGGAFVGSRTSDAFVRSGPSAGSCQTETCNATYDYDAQGRLSGWSNGRGSATSYTLLPNGNISEEVTTGPGATTRVFTYSSTAAQQVATITTNGVSRNYFHDTEGNLTCVTSGTGGSTDCPAQPGTSATTNTPSPKLRAALAYDYRKRLASFRSFANDDTATVVDTGSYTYDPYDRVATQKETHPTGSDRSTAFAYLGSSTVLGKATVTRASGSTTKDFAHGAADAPIGLTVATGQTSNSWDIGYDPKGSVSQLTDGSTTAASYGYSPYGARDADLSLGDQADDPLSPFGFQGKRVDTGSNTIDMGARRYSPETTRFLQEDVLTNALNEADLAESTVTSNRYALSGANPVGFSELDGHLSYYTAHEAAVKVTAAAAGKFYRGFVGSGGYVEVTTRRRENRIPGAAYRNCGENGYPDIVLRDHLRQEARLWEVKARRQSRRCAFDQLNGYIRGMRRMTAYNTWTVGHGFAMPDRNIFFYKLFRVHVWSALTRGEPYPGIEVYNRKWGRDPKLPDIPRLPELTPEQWAWLLALIAAGLALPHWIDDACGCPRRA